ncbi:MAG: Minf_1886 family protein [Phycisphaerales bacterium]
MHEHQIDLNQVFQQAGGYSPACFPFIRDGLAHTSKMVHGQPEDQSALDLGLADDSRHVDGTQLCLGLREHALARYGLLAKSVLNNWGIYETRDFGKIIFALVDANLMRTTEEDSIEDFDNVFDFDEEFALPAPSAPVAVVS